MTRLHRTLREGDSIVLTARDGRPLGTAVVAQARGGRATLVLVLPPETLARQELAPPVPEDARALP